MSEAASPDPRRLDPKRYEWRPWKVVAVGVGLLLVVVGAVLALSNDESGAKSRTDVASGADGAPSAVDGAPRADGDGAHRMFEPLPDEPGADEPASDDAASGSDAARAPGARSGDASSIDWSPALLRGGFSFLVAFSVAFALRTFMRIAVFFLGVWGASLFLLANLGWIEVHWSAIEIAFTGWTGTLGDQFESFGRFVTGSLPTTGLAAAGLYTGLRRK